MLCIVIPTVSRDNRVSLWQLSAPRTEDELPGVECLSVVAGCPIIHPHRHNAHVYALTETPHIQGTCLQFQGTSALSPKYMTLS